jgi:four helix bundle protein
VNLTGEIYRQFRHVNDYGFRDQVRRAAVSVPSNIAEGFERQSNKEFIQFLFIARGSSGELRTQQHLAMDLGFVENQKGHQLIEQTRKKSAMLSKLIETRKENF